MMLIKVYADRTFAALDLAVPQWRTLPPHDRDDLMRIVYAAVSHGEELFQKYGREQFNPKASPRQPED